MPCAWLKIERESSPASAAVTARISAVVLMTPTSTVSTTCLLNSRQTAAPLTSIRSVKRGDEPFSPSQAPRIKPTVAQRSTRVVAMLPASPGIRSARVDNTNAKRAKKTNVHGVRRNVAHPSCSAVPTDRLMVWSPPLWNVVASRSGGRNRLGNSIDRELNLPCRGVPAQAETE